MEIRNHYLQTVMVFQIRRLQNEEIYILDSIVKDIYIEGDYFYTEHIVQQSYKYIEVLLILMVT